MGPDRDTFNSVPTRPRCSWDIRTPPWTDGKGSAESFLDSVNLWKEFHDSLPANNSNKISPNLQGIILKSQLFGRAKDLGSKIVPEDLKSDDGALKLAHAVYKIDALSQVSTMAEQFNKLLNTKREPSEKMKTFEGRFEAEMCKFNESAGTMRLPDALIALMLISNAGIDNNQRVALLASVAPASTESLSAENIPNAIGYDKIASILRSSDAPTDHAKRMLSASTASTISSRAKEISDQKKKSKCGKCGEIGHWWRDDECPLNKKGDDDEVNSSRKRTISFN